MACNTNSLSAKLVINICDARRLGHICNYEIDLCEGRIVAVFVPGDCGFFGFARGHEIRIPWERIKKIGEDAILVELPAVTGECRQTPPKKKWFW